MAPSFTLAPRATVPLAPLLKPALVSGPELLTERRDANVIINITYLTKYKYGFTSGLLQIRDFASMAASALVV